MHRTDRRKIIRIYKPLEEWEGEAKLNKLWSTGKPDYKIYTDGSGASLKGPGGWAWCMYKGATLLEGEYGPILDCPNNYYAELYAIIQALLRFEKMKDKHVDIISDCQSIINGLTLHYAKWELKGWVNLKGDPICFQKEYQMMMNFIETVKGKLRFKWVKGHATTTGNIIADKYSKEGRKWANEMMKETNNATTCDLYSTY